MPLASRYLAEETGLDLEKMRKDMHAVGSLDAGQIAALDAFLGGGTHLLKRDEVIGQEIQAFCGKNDVTPATFAAARRLSRLLLEAQRKFDEDVKTILPGLDAIGAFQELQEEEAARVREFLAGLADSVAVCSRVDSRNRQLSQSMPALRGVSISTNVRAVLRRPFTPLRDEAASYEPAIVEFVPVGIVSLVADEPQSRISVQLDQRDLDRLLDCLIALKKELDEASAVLSKTGVPVPDVRLEEKFGDH